MQASEDSVAPVKASGGWEHIDVALRSIVKQRGLLDVNEAKWIREALRVKIWREVGCVSMIDYMERRLGYAPRTASDRVRVAVTLEELPKLAAALGNGMPYSAARELTRVATNENEQTWLDAVRGKTVHEIEGMVSGRGRGANPDDPSHPSLAGRTMSFEAVRPATEALVRDARRKLQDERGGGAVISDDEVLASFARAVLEGGEGERTKAPYQVAVTLCEQCGRGWQDSGGRKFGLSTADIERACCDAERIGSLDADGPERATQDVTPAKRRLVRRRDRGGCRVPGCRSTRCLEIHHIVARILGGSHELENMILICDSCHAALHRGLITISGTSAELVVTRRHEVAFDVEPTTDEDLDESAHVGTSAAHPAAVSSPSADQIDETVDGHGPNAHVGTSAAHPAARISSPSADWIDETVDGHGPNAHVGTSAAHPAARVSSPSADQIDETVDGHGPNAHVGTRVAHPAARVSSPSADQIDETVDRDGPDPHVGTRVAGPASVSSHAADWIDETVDGHGPNAHVGTSAAHSASVSSHAADWIDETVDRDGPDPHVGTRVAGPASVSSHTADWIDETVDGHGPNAHVGTSVAHSASVSSHAADWIDETVDRDGPEPHVGTRVAGPARFSSPSADQIDETVDGHGPNAHVGTSAAHPAARVSSPSADWIDETVDGHGPNAHVGTRVAGPASVSSHTADWIDETVDGHGPNAHVGTIAHSASISSHTADWIDETKPADQIVVCDRRAPGHVGTKPPPQNGSAPSAQLSKFERERLRADARSALVNLGFRPGEAGKAVDSAMRVEEVTLDEILREALRFLRPPTTG